MEKLLTTAKKSLMLLLSFTIMITSSLACLTANAQIVEGYAVSETENGIACQLDGVMQSNVYLFISSVDETLAVSDCYDETTSLYYFDQSGVGSVYTGICDGNYYVDGKLSISDSAFYIVFDGMLYEIAVDGSACVYVKDSANSSTYKMVVDDICYNVRYSTGEVTKFTGVYSSKYYKSGVLGTADKSYYKVYSSKLYKVSANGSASVYKKDTSKSGTYRTLVDSVCYDVNYKTGAAAKFTGVYSGKYYKSGKLGTASGTYYKVYSDKLYVVSKNGSASVYKKDTKKSGTYRKLVDSVCYDVSYKTGAAKKYTGVYSSKYYKSGKLTNGWQTLSGKKYYCKSGVAVKGINKIEGKVYYFDSKGVMYTGSGWKTVSNKKYYFTKGVAKTGWVVINDILYNFNSNGVMSKSKKVDGININANGKATGPAKAYVPVYAKALSKNIISKSNSKEKNLRLCFDYVMKHYKSNGNPRIPHYTKVDWIYVYANDMFGDRGGGNCFSYAAAFAFLAKECGYENVYGCNSGGHGWVEIDGKVYDPEQYKDVGKKIYGWDYNTPGITNYKPAISGYKKNPWMYVKIPG